MFFKSIHGLLSQKWGGIIWNSIIKLTFSELGPFTIKLLVSCLAMPFLLQVHEKSCVMIYGEKQFFPRSFNSGLREIKPFVDDFSIWIANFFISIFMFYHHLHVLKDGEASWMLDTMGNFSTFFPSLSFFSQG